MADVKIIALDLDGTLLTSDKTLSERNFEALRAAAEQGVEIVPCTGRYYLAMPEVIRNLPFVRYVITINGAAIADRKEDKLISETLLPFEEAIAIMEFLDTQPVVYDCYQGRGGYMTKSMQDAIESYCNDPHYIKMVRDLREPVPELKTYLTEQHADVQKIQFFTLDDELRKRLFTEIPARFPDLAMSSSMKNNIEINHKNANKGTALLALAAHLGVDRSQTMAFGDGLNDLDMIREAGVGVGMANAKPEVLQEANVIAPTNDEDGVAAVIEAVLRGESYGAL